MKRFVRNGGLALLLLVFAGCRDPTGPRSVTAARMLWESHNFTDYSYVASRVCFCPPPANARVVVSGGRVVSVTDLSSNTQVSTAGWMTVDELFDFVERATLRSLEFDREFGYPKRIETCCIENDSGGIYTVSDLQAVVRPSVAFID